MNTLVTGCAGYVGSVLTPLLLQAGHEVTGLDTIRYGQFSLADCFAYPQFKLIRGDVRNSELVKELVQDKEIIIWLAAIVGAPASAEDESLAWEVNFESVRQLTTFLKPEQLLVFPQTNSGYGIGGEDLCTEESPLNPISVYGRSKNAAESHILFYHKNAAIFRYATLFGLSPRMRFDLLVNNFTRRAILDRFLVLFEGHFRRNYLHVRDAAGAIIGAIEQKIKPGIYNCGLPDANLTKRELCERIKLHLPDFYFCEASIGQDPDRRDYEVSNARILSTGWRPQYTLDDGIAELIRAMPMYKDRLWQNG